jgi:hypothetical protein
MSPATEHHPTDPGKGQPPKRTRPVTSVLPPLEPVTCRDLRDIARHDVEPGHVASKLRGMLGLPPEEPAPDELAASSRHHLPPVVHGLDCGAWIAWSCASLVVILPPRADSGMSFTPVLESGSSSRSGIGPCSRRTMAHVKPTISPHLAPVTRACRPELDHHHGH